MAISTGVLPGLKFSHDNEGMPWSTLRDFLISDYKHQSPYPIFAELDSFSKNEIEALYYSFAMHTCTEKLTSRLKHSRKTDDLMEVYRLIEAIQMTIEKEKINLHSNQYKLVKTFYEKKLNYFHNQLDTDPNILTPEKIQRIDSTVKSLTNNADQCGKSLRLDSPFFNGLIRISNK